MENEKIYKYLEKLKNCIWKNTYLLIRNNEKIKFKQWLSRRVLGYQRGSENSYIEEETKQWPKEKVQKDKQWSTKHYT
jgi:hypothetical protein